MLDFCLFVRGIVSVHTNERGKKTMTGKEFISKIVAYSKYAKYLPEEQRRETIEEIFLRNRNMHVVKYPHMEKEIDEVFELMKQGKFLPAMRSLQFGGDAILKHEARMYNCSACGVDDVKFFSEAMYLLLCGCGLGYSVRKHHIDQLPDFNFGEGTESYVIEDSIEGWSNAIHRIIQWAFEGAPLPVFGYSEIRLAGSRLSSGVIAPGHEKLQQCINKIIDLLWNQKTKGITRMASLVAHDIACHTADCVVSGGVRRSAMIVLFDWNDIDMLECKIGDWWMNNPQRARANNSAALDSTLTEEEQKVQFDFVTKYAKQALLTGSGDPALIWIEHPDYLFNPCAEAYLNYNSCNLVEIIGRHIKTQEDLNASAKAGAFWATLQAGYTNFKYLRPKWQERTELEALIGVGITGMVDAEVLNLDLMEAAEIVKAENERVAKLIGINKAHRTTVIKPAGNSTLFAQCYGSGCHDAFSTTSYVRRMRIGKNEPIYHWLIENVPSLVEDEAFDPSNTAVLSVPIRVNEGEVSQSTNDDPIKFLERVKFIYDNWIIGGHNEGPGTNNVSATCYVTPEQHDEVFQWMWDNKAHYKGISLLPKDNANYPQMPLELASETVIEAMEKSLVDFDPRMINEPFDMVNFISEGACISGQCSVV